MTDNASIARPYAKAVFELAKETKAFDAWSQALANAALVAADADFTALANDPRIDNSRLSELLLDLCKKSLPEGGDNLIRLLVQNSRVNALQDIQKQYELLVAEAQQAVNAEVITAKALSDKQKTALSKALEKRLGLKVSLVESIDESLVGGAIVKAGDLVIDGSVQGRIEKLTGVLTR